MCLRVKSEIDNSGFSGRPTNIRKRRFSASSSNPSGIVRPHKATSEGLISSVTRKEKRRVDEGRMEEAIRSSDPFERKVSKCQKV